MTAIIDDGVNSLEEDISADNENSTDSPLDNNDKRTLENIKDQGVEG